MKKVFAYAFIGLSLAVGFTACRRAENPLKPITPETSSEDEENGDEIEPEKIVTIQVGLSSDGVQLSQNTPSAKNLVVAFSDEEEAPDTKVALTQDPTNAKVIKPTWEVGDKLSVNGNEFTLVSGAGTNAAVFSGVEPTPDANGRYTVTLLSPSAGPADYNNQVQSADDDLSHLGYSATLSNSPCYGQDAAHAIQFTQDWADANGATLSNQMSVLRLRAKLPASFSADVREVVFSSSANCFNGSNTIKVTLGTPGVQSGDNILDIYAAIPPFAGDAIAVPNLQIVFQVGDAEHAYNKHVHYRRGTMSLKSGGHTISVSTDCTDIEKFANGRTEAGLGSSSNPYLLADQFQVKNFGQTLVASSTTYYKMHDDVDMTSVAAGILTDCDKAAATRVDFEGDGKTISNFTGGTLFYQLGGAVRNLTFINCTPTSGGNQGILAQYVNQANTVVSNVDLESCTIGTASTNAGGLIARVNNVAAPDIALTMSGCDVNDIAVSSGQRAGGLVGNAESAVSVSDCSVSASSVSGVTYVGGIAGFIGGASSTVSSCTVTGTGLEGAARMGGVLGDVGANGVLVSGCSYADGNITQIPSLITSGTDDEKASNTRFVGGLIGMVENYTVTVRDCHVTGDVTLDFSAKTSDVRGGGLIGCQHGNPSKTRIEGCTVGTVSKKVLIKTGSPNPSASSHHNRSMNVGGFVGVNYGTITQNGAVHCESHVKITSSNTQDARLNLGGFLGYHRGTVEYCDADADLTGITGQYVGGFAGLLVDELDNPTISRHNTVTATVSGSSLVGGYAGGVEKEITEYTGGYAPSIIVTDCQVLSGTTVSGTSEVGGFAGKFFYGTVSGADVTATVTGTDNVGGFAGEYDSTVSLSDCAVSSTAVSATAGSAGGFAGTALAAAPAGSDLSVSGGSVTATAFAGGFSANVGAVAFNDLLVDGCNVTSTCGADAYADSVGGLVADVSVAASFDNCTVQNLTVTANTSASTHGIAGGAIGHLAGGATAGTSAGNHVTNVNIVGYDYAGGFAGLIQGNARVENNVVSGGTLGGNNNVGGFAGRCNPSTHSRNSTSMIVGSDAATRPGIRVGGYVGYTTNGTYTDCVASGDVTGLSTDVGGFVGLVGGGSFSGCTASGAVSSADAGVGGFVGSVNKGNVPFTSCRYEGTSVTCTKASGDVHTGGFCGRAANEPITVNWTDCRVQHPNNNQIYVTSTAGSWIGGFIGTAGKNSDENTGVITGCAARNVRVTGVDYIGGFAGVSYMAISECWATGNQNATVTVTGYRGGGGFIGYLSRKPVSNCYTNASIVANGQIRVGGFAGVILPSGSIVNSWVKNYSIDWGTTRGGTTGCFAGNNQGGSTITDCITWTSDSAPFCGASGTVSANCYKGVSANGLTSISARAQSFGTWDTGIWDFEQSEPLLVNNMP